MKTMTLLGTAVMGTLLAASAFADEPLERDAQDPNQWVLPLGSYSGIRHSKLTQINTRNAAKLKVAWTMSTGTLRGQEGHLRVQGSLGVHRTWNADHLVGRTANTVVGQVVATLRIGRRGALR